MVSSSSTVMFASEEVLDRFLSNVDVWQTIFEMLSLKDRMRLEMTNKRLRILMCACWERVTSFDTECVAEMSSNPSISKNRWAAFTAICVDRIGARLRSLTIREKFPPISRYPIPVWSANLCPIGEGCPNIETINFVFEGEYRTLDIRFYSFSRLKTLTVSPATGGFTPASASVFLSIPSSIEVIRGLEGKKEEPFENAAQMEGFFADRPSLREVCIGELQTRDESKADMFRVIAERCPNVKSIKFPHVYFNYITNRGVVFLESMKELRMPFVVLDEMQILTICERSPLLEVLAFTLRFSSNLHLQSAALNALGALTKLARLCFYICSEDVVAASLTTEFVRELARNSGASLRRLDIEYGMPLPRAAIEALANGCAKLRSLYFHVRVGEATPASIRFLIDSIVADPSWIPQTDQPTLFIDILVIHDDGDDREAGRAPFKALAEPAANLPAGVQLRIR